MAKNETKESNGLFQCVVTDTLVALTLSECAGFYEGIHVHETPVILTASLEHDHHTHTPETEVRRAIDEGTTKPLRAIVSGTVALTDDDYYLPLQQTQQATPKPQAILDDDACHSSHPHQQMITACIFTKCSS